MTTTPTVCVKIPHITAKGVAPGRFQPIMCWKELKTNERHADWLAEVKPKLLSEEETTEE